MTHKPWFGILIVVLVLVLGARIAVAQENFYKGKTIRVIVGASAGGGFDTYARTIARHMPRHVPGNPSIIVENMPGAGSLISANHIYRVAKPDGLTMGHFVGGLFVKQLTGRPGIDFDAVKFQFVGAPIPDKAACALTKASGITSMEQWMRAKTPGRAPSSPIP
jgi:tripartite-type tricarboxylate transporter receptor subunit TctC